MRKRDKVSNQNLKVSLKDNGLKDNSYGEIEMNNGEETSRQFF